MTPEELQALIDSWSGRMPAGPTAAAPFNPGLAGRPGFTEPPVRAPMSRPVRAAPPEPRRPLTLWERVGGVPGTNLTEDERSAAKRGGIAGILEGFLTGGPVGAVKGRRAGAVRGIETYDALVQRRLAQAAQTRQQEFYSKFQNANLRDPNVLQDMFLNAATIPGMEKTTGMLGEVLKSLKGSGSRATPHSAVNEATGRNEEYIIGDDNLPHWLGLQSTPKGDRGAQLKSIMQPDGTVKYGSWDPDKPTEVTMLKEGPPSYAGVGERRAAMFTPMFEKVKPVFAKFGGAPGRFEQWASQVGARELTSDMMQQLQIAGNMYAEAWARLTTGATMRAEEKVDAWRTFSPLPGDKPGTLELKFQLREVLEKFMASAEGRAALAKSFEPVAPVGGGSLDDFMRGGTP